EIAFRTVEEHADQRVFLLSEMIHNPRVNADLQARGIQFLMDTKGGQLIPWEELTAEDIVIIPAFGTTVEIQEKLDALGLETKKYNTTCPFVEKVWKASTKLGAKDYSVIIHGKATHEETRATFSHSKEDAPALVVQNMEETKVLANYILGKIDLAAFHQVFANRYSANFDPEKHLDRIGVVNQTTMLATDTQAIADFLKETMIQKYGDASIKDHFADTRDTLCYATNDNQRANIGMLEAETGASFAIVVGGYNSSNTTHLVELCEEKLPTYFISSADKILSDKLINHFDWRKKEEFTTEDFIPSQNPLTVLITSGASCPDITVDEVLQRILSFFDGVKSVDEVLEGLEKDV
ncbi:MAG: 4-hydroxy-3-methylbut-2-enyl diphosphate reductase, partial [Flammeovirgaceae bacterium]